MFPMFDGLHAFVYVVLAVQPKEARNAKGAMEPQIVRRVVALSWI